MGWDRMGDMKHTPRRKREHWKQWHWTENVSIIQRNHISRTLERLVAREEEEEGLLIEGT